MTWVHSIRWACAAVAMSLAIATVSVAAETSAPERLLAPDALVYWRFDGWAPHQAAFDKTTFGELLQGDLGEFLNGAKQLALKRLSDSSIGNSLLAGKHPEELAKIQAAAKQFPVFWPAICQHGFVLAIEGSNKDRSAHAIVILPKGKSLLSLAQLVIGQFGPTPVERKIGDRRVLVAQDAAAAKADNAAADDEDASRAGESSNAAMATAKLVTAKPAGRGKALKRLARSIAPDLPTGPFRTLAWAEGDDLVIVVSNRPTARTVEQIVDRHDQSLLSSPIYKRLVGFNEYETLSRGFVDLKQLIAEPYFKINNQYDVSKILAGIGLGNVRQLEWHTGVEGRNLRSSVELLIPGKREGILKFLPTNRELHAWPPMPPDITEFEEFGIHLAGANDEINRMAQKTAKLIGADPVKVGTAIYGAQIAATTFLGIDIQHDLLDSLGSTVVVYSSPSEGPLSLGTALAIEVRDSDKLRKTLHALETAATSAAGSDLQIKHRQYHGVDAATIHYASGDGGTNFPANIFMPTYTLYDGWLVVSLNPQTVEGYILRAKSQSETKKSGHPAYQTWKTTPLFDEMCYRWIRREPEVTFLAMGMSDPRPGLKNTLALAPLVATALSNSKTLKLDNWLMPNSQAIVEPLYPNVWLLVDTGESLRRDDYKSVPFPFDSAAVMAPFGAYIALLGGVF